LAFYPTLFRHLFRQIRPIGYPNRHCIRPFNLTSERKRRPTSRSVLEEYLAKSTIKFRIGSPITSPPFKGKNAFVISRKAETAKAYVDDKGGLEQASSSKLPFAGAFEIAIFISVVAAALHRRMFLHEKRQ